MAQPGPHPGRRPSRRPPAAAAEVNFKLRALGPTLDASATQADHAMDHAAECHWHSGTFVTVEESRDGQLEIPGQLIE